MLDAENQPDPDRRAREDEASRPRPASTRPRRARRTSRRWRPTSSGSTTRSGCTSRRSARSRCSPPRKRSSWPRRSSSASCRRGPGRVAREPLHLGHARQRAKARSMAAMRAFDLPRSRRTSPATRIDWWTGRRRGDDRAAGIRLVEGAARCRNPTTRPEPDHGGRVDPQGARLGSGAGAQGLGACSAPQRSEAVDHAGSASCMNLEAGRARHARQIVWDEYIESGNDAEYLLEPRLRSRRSRWTSR